MDLICVEHCYCVGKLLHTTDNITIVTEMTLCILFASTLLTLPFRASLRNYTKLS